jgi:hypothetical protein
MFADYPLMRVGAGRPVYGMPMMWRITDGFAFLLPGAGGPLGDGFPTDYATITNACVGRPSDADPRFDVLRSP